jgi:hypothetical protein
MTVNAHSIFMIGMLQLLIKGVTIELSYLKLKYGDDLYQNVDIKFSAHDAFLK